MSDECERDIIEHNDAAGGGDIEPDKLKRIANNLRMIRGGLTDVTVAMILTDYIDALREARTK